MVIKPLNQSKPNQIVDLDLFQITLRKIDQITFGLTFKKSLHTLLKEISPHTIMVFFNQYTNAHTQIHFCYI